MRIALGNDHAGLGIKAAVIKEIESLGHTVTDYGTAETSSVDFPDFAAPVGRALQMGDAERGVLICGSGVGMCIAANKMMGIRACVCHDTYSAHQGVEHDDMNVLCMGANIIGPSLARELVRSYLGAEYQHEERYMRRMGKVASLEAERAKEPTR